MVKNILYRHSKSYADIHCLKGNIVVIGSLHCGKSSLIVRFVCDKFLKDYEPTLQDIFTTEIIVDNQSCYLEIFDTSGSNLDFPVINVDVFIGVYAIDDLNSFRYLKKIVQFIKEKRNEPFFLILVGTKCDLEKERKISYEKGINFIITLPYAHFFEASSLLNMNVENIFVQSIKFIKMKKLISLQPYFIQSKKSKSLNKLIENKNKSKKKIISKEKLQSFEKQNNFIISSTNWNHEQCILI